LHNTEYRYFLFFQVYLFRVNWFYNCYKHVKTKFRILDKNLIIKYLQKITTSRHFNKSKVSCELLEYLVQASIENKNPKEYTIGIELFGRKYEDDAKQDSNIRVYIHNMRKKLEDYYEDEGSRDAIVFVLERGKYRIHFKTRKEYDAVKPRAFVYPFAISLVLLVMVTVLYFLKGSESRQKSLWRSLPVWQEFVGNGKETLLILGDYFVFSGILPTGNGGIYRDFSINSEKEFQELLNKKPDLVKVLSRSNLTYLSKMTVFCESDILRVFAQTGAGISVKLLSDVQPSDLKSNNIIFIGNYKNMGILANVIREMEFPFGVANASVQYIFSNDPCAQVYEAPNRNPTEEDYALVIHAPGYDGNRFLFFLSSQDIGNISTVSQLTNPAYLKQFTEEQLKPLKKSDFKALYKVQGINKTDLSFELIRVE
jgi:hypothetical protein